MVKIDISLNSLSKEFIKNPELLGELFNCMCKSLKTQDKIDEYFEKVENFKKKVE